MKMLTNVLESVVRRLGRTWRAPGVQVLFASQVPGLIVVTGLMAALGVYVMFRRYESIGNVALALGIIVSLALTRGAVGGDRRASRWTVLFQMPITPLRFYFRTLAIRLVFATTLIAAVSLMWGLALPFTELPARALFASVVVTWLGTLVLVVLGFSLACLVRVREQSALLLMLVVSVLQKVLLHAWGLDVIPFADVVLLYTLFPVDPLFDLLRVLAFGGPWNGAAAVWQVGITLAFWLAIAVARLQYFARSDLPSALED
jgi:hypothetical protein